MVVEKNFALTALIPEHMEDMNEIIKKHANIILKTSSHMYFNVQPTNPADTVQDITFFHMKADDETAFDEKLKKLIEEINQVDVNYALRDEGNGKMVVCMEFLGVIDIKLDHLRIIKKGTYKKIDELKDMKTELGVCKGYKPNFRPIEGKPIGNVNIYPEYVYLLCHSMENVLKLKEMLIEKITQIDADLKTEFRVYTEKDLEKLRN